MKYEFTGETKVFFGGTLKRIRALVSFGAVAAGELGGWIENEKNLAQVSGDAWVSGDADFFLVGPIGSRRSFLTVHADEKFGIRFTTGCFSGNEAELKKAIQDTHADNEHGKHYLAAIDLAKAIVKPYSEGK